MTARPRILLLVTLAEVGGAQTYLAHLVPGLVAEFEVTVAAWGPGPLRAAVEAAGARYIALQHVRRDVSLWRDPLGLLELVRLCRRLRPDIVHANSSKAGILGRIAARIAGVPVRIFTVHGWAFAQYHGTASKVYLWLDRLVRPLTTSFICVSSQTRAAGVAARTCDPDATIVIPNAVDVATAPRAELTGDPPRVVSVGRLKEPKDFVGLVRALAGTGVPFRAAIVGDGPDRPEIEGAVSARGLEDSVELLGERGDVAALLAASDVFVLSSRSEGMPISVLEAMAAGLPVVASAVGGVPELAEDAVTGLLVPAGDEAALRGALARILADAALRRSLGEAGRRRAEEKFDLPRFRAAHLELYRAELARSGRNLDQSGASADRHPTQ
jgi:glycosyltransferase involved in cell wall biosynthesis